MRSWMFLLALAACGGAEPSAPAPAKAAPVAAAPAKAVPAKAAPVAKKAAPAAKAGEAAAAGDAKAGAKTYDQYCKACHQADGSGMNGMLAANFKDDPKRLEKSDEELLKSISDGLTSKIGTMPPWKGTLSEEQQVDVLAFIRASFGKK